MSIILYFIHTHIHSPLIINIYIFQNPSTDQLAQLLINEFQMSEQRNNRRVNAYRAYNRTNGLANADSVPVNPELYQNANKLIPSMLIGQNLSENDYQNESLNYQHYVQQLSNYLQRESKLFADVLNYMQQENQKQHNQLMFGHLLNLDKVQKLLDDFNMKIKKCQRISNKRWCEEVLPMLKSIVWLLSLDSTFNFCYCVLMLLFFFVES